MTPEELEEFNRWGKRGNKSGMAERPVSTHPRNQAINQLSAFEKIDTFNEGDRAEVVDIRTKGQKEEYHDPMAGLQPAEWLGSEFDNNNTFGGETQPTFRLNPEANRAAFDALNEKYPSANFNFYMPDVDWNSPEAEAKFQATVPKGETLEQQAARIKVTIAEREAKEKAEAENAYIERGADYIGKGGFEQSTGMEFDMAGNPKMILNDSKSALIPNPKFIGNDQGLSNQEKMALTTVANTPLLEGNGKSIFVDGKWITDPNDISQGELAKNEAEALLNVSSDTAKERIDKAVNEAQTKFDSLDTEAEVRDVHDDTEVDAKVTVSKIETDKVLTATAEAWHNAEGDAEGQANIGNLIKAKLQDKKEDKGFLANLNSWIVDNPALAGGLANALVGFISTGSAYKALGLGIQGYINGVGKADADKKAWDKIGRELMIDDGATPASVKKYLETRNIEDLRFTSTPPEIKSAAHGSKYVNGVKVDYWNTTRGMWIRDPENSNRYIPASVYGQGIGQARDWNAASDTDWKQQGSIIDFGKEKSTQISSTFKDMTGHSPAVGFSGNVVEAVQRLKRTYGLKIDNADNYAAINIAIDEHARDEAARYLALKKDNEEDTFVFETDLAKVVTRKIVFEKAVKSGISLSIFNKEDGSINKDGTSKMYKKINNFIQSNKDEAMSLGDAVSVLYDEWLADVWKGKEEDALSKATGKSTFLYFVNNTANFKIGE
jgi:hypothetical protein